MLHLLAPSSSLWLDACLADVSSVLIDHVHCEHKAAVSALALVARMHDDHVLVEALTALAAEEASHMHEVAKLCFSRGLAIGSPTSEDYARSLMKLCRKSLHESRVDRLLIASIIEARSCERLQLLSIHLPEESLRIFYDRLWREEAKHHTLFFELALRQAPSTANGGWQETTERLQQLMYDEAEIIKKIPIKAAIH